LGEKRGAGYCENTHRRAFAGSAKKLIVIYEQKTKETVGKL
jgi:hypothetical protein